MADASPEVPETKGHRFRSVLIPDYVWGEIEVQASRINVSPQEFVSMCLAYGAKNPWDVFAGWSKPPA